MTTRSNRPTRGTQTRFDDTRQKIIKSVIGVLVGILVLALILLAIMSWLPRVALTITGGGFRRATDAVPRNTDIWAVYPDDQVRFITIFHPVVESGVETIRVDIAGPLMFVADDVVSSEMFGGDLAGSTTLPGPGGDSGYVYEKYDLDYLTTGDPYGADVTVNSPPYLSTEDDVKTIALGADPQTYYQQVTVVIGFPRGTTIRKIPDMRAYRRVKLDGWVFFYFDTSVLAERNEITIEYVMDKVPDTLPDFDYFEVDARR